MFRNMTTFKAMFKKAEHMGSTKGPAASEQEPPRGCLPMFGCKRLAKALSRTNKVTKGVPTSRDKLEQHVEHLNQQTNGITLQIQVLSDGMVKCAIAVVQPVAQPNSQPASDDVAPAECSCSNLNNEPLDDGTRAESASKHTSCRGATQLSELGSVDVDAPNHDAACDIVLTDTASLPGRANCKGIRTYSNKLANWCKKVALDISSTSHDVLQKTISNRRSGSSNNSRRSSLLEWGSTLVSFRKGSSA